jgi:putative ABC transport system permease protein
MRQTWLDAIWHDGRYAVRNLRRRPWGFMAAVFMLGLAIGITAAMFTIVDALILRPVPFKDPDQLATVVMGGQFGGPPPTPAVFKAWRESPAFAAVEGAVWSTALIGSDSGEVTRGIARVTPGVFDLLGGVRPVRGRLFDASEGRPGNDDRVLLSQDLWRALFHSDPALVGRSITIDGKPVVVVGILPSEFRFPQWNTVVWRAANFETPQAAALGARPVVYVRFAANVPRADALRVATTVAREADASENATRWAQSRSLSAFELDAYYARAVPLLSGGVVLLFLVLCANVSSLLLAGLAARGRELATRTALGASRSRLVRQAFLESVVTGAGGIVAGAGIGWGLVSVARAVLPQAALLHSLNPLNLDARALAVTSIAGLVATLAAGVLPAVIGTRVDAGRSLQLAGRSSTETPRARLARGGLLVCQIALSCTLLLGATLLVRSFIKLVKEDRGLDTSNILIASVMLPSRSFTTPDARNTAARVLAERVRALPGVERSAWSYGTPPDGGINPSGDWISDAPGAPSVNMKVNQFVVDADYFPLYGVPILRGRAFQSFDEAGAVLVSERFARALWPGVDPIGRRFTFKGYKSHVVGLVKEIRFPSLDRTKDAPQLYGQFKGVLNLGMLSVRCAVRCPDPVVVRRQMAAAQPGSDIESVRPLEDRYFAELARPRAAASLAFAFAATALVAVAAGLFSLLSHGVARRRREFGIRMALGASPADVRRLVWHDGMAVTLIGIGIGTVAGLSLARMLASLLFDVTMTDPLSWVIVVGVLTLTIAAASWHPTRTAVRAAPVVLLREE